MQDGSSCSIKDQEHRFSFRKYKHKFKDQDQFLLYKDAQNIRSQDFKTDIDLTVYIYNLFYKPKNINN